MEKKRNLLKSNIGNEHENITLQKLIHTLTNCALPLSELEVKNTKAALRNSKNALRDFKKQLIAFELFINTTVTQEVIFEVNRNTAHGVVYGNPNKLVHKIKKANQSELDKVNEIKVKSSLEQGNSFIEYENEDYF